MEDFWRVAKSIWAWIYSILTIIITVGFPKNIPYSGRGSPQWLVPSIGLVVLLIMWCIGIFIRRDRKALMNWKTASAVIFMIVAGIIGIIFFTFSAFGDQVFPLASRS